MVGALAGGALILLWWLLFSRAPWAERLGVIGLMIVALLATSRVVHASISNGFMGMMFPLITIPFLGLALVVGAVASRRSSTGTRRAAIAAAIVLACGAVTLVTDLWRGRRRGVGFPLALDHDARRTAARARKRRTRRRCRDCACSCVTCGAGINSGRTRSCRASSGSSANGSRERAGGFHQRRDDGASSRSRGRQDKSRVARLPWAGARRRGARCTDRS